MAGADPDVDRDLDRLLSQLAARLRGLSARAWSAGTRRDAVRRVVVELAALSAPGRSVPQLPDHALGDAVGVIGRDGLSAPQTRERAAQLVRDALDATR